MITTTILMPSGLLVVNYSDRNRIITLCQRSRHVPRGPMLAINMDARYFSGIRRSHIIKHKEGYKQKYDEVLCDVPCSEGLVTAQTSLRVAAAMLVVLHKYSEVISSPDSSNKRRRLE